MSVPIATTIAELTPDQPTDATPGYDVDDWIKQATGCLQTQFPGIAGAGFAIPIDANETEINYLQGVTGPIQPQLNVAVGERIPTQVSAVPGNIATWSTDGTVVDSEISMQEILNRLAALESA